MAHVGSSEKTLENGTNVYRTVGSGETESFDVYTFKRPMAVDFVSIVLALQNHYQGKGAPTSKQRYVEKKIDITSDENAVRVQLDGFSDRGISLKKTKRGHLSGVIFHGISSRPSHFLEGALKSINEKDQSKIFKGLQWT